MFQKAKFILFTLIFMIGSQAIVWAADPGPFPGVAAGDLQAGDSKPGSVLIYNLFTSSAANVAHDTQISVTNTNSGRPAFVHLFFVSQSCTVADSFICLTPNQTAGFLASDIDPGVTGYIVAVATNQEGCPVEFNFLIGSEYVKVRDFRAKLSAEAIYANYDGVLPRCDANIAEAVLRFNGRQYGRLPRVLALDEIGSNRDGNQTALVLNSINGNLTAGMAPIGGIVGALYDDTENAFRFGLRADCQLLTILNDQSLVTTPIFAAAIPAGRSGWMRLWATQERAMTGAALRANADTATNREAFSGGANLNHLRMAENVTITMPVFPPSC